MLRVGVFGNGLSVSANSRFRLPDLTQTVRTRLDEVVIGGQTARQWLDTVADNMLADNDPPQWHGDFERLLGPLDRLSRVLNTDLRAVIGGLRPELRDQLEEISGEVRALYLRGVAAVLAVIDENVSVEAVANLEPVVRWLTEGQQAADRVAIYSLNYDALLDRALFALMGELAPDGQPRIRLADEFSGHDADAFQVPVSNVVGDAIVARLPRTDTWTDRRRPLDLFHLHGGEQWLRTSDGLHVKAQLADIRARHLHERWMAGESLLVQPAVVLTDQKSRAVDRPPFDNDYAHLRDDLLAADRVVISGYGFGDVPLNRVLGEAYRKTHSNPTAVWLITRRAIPPEEEALEVAFLRGALDLQELPAIAFGDLPQVLEEQNDLFE